MIGKTLLSAALMIAAPVLASAQDIAITNAKAWTGTDTGTLDDATIIVRDGKIASVAANQAAPSDMRTVDAAGRWVTPGLIAPFSRVGLVEVGAEDAANDTMAATSGASVRLNAADGFNPRATTIPVTRLEGVTRIVVAPANAMSLFAGQGFVADTSGDPNSITRNRAFVFIDLSETGALLAGGSRPAAWAALRGAVADARGYPGRFIGVNTGDTLSRADAQAFGPAVRGEQLVLVAAHRASDLRKVIDLKQQVPTMRLAVVGADEGWMVADELAAANIPVIIDPFSNLPASFAQLGATAHNAERLIDAGVVTAFAHLGDNGHQARLVPQSAGNAVANGVSHDQALAAITTAPASIFGLTELGAIRAGATADLVLWNGDPLEVMSAPDLILIEGDVQSMESRQTKLRDRYMTLDESQRPLAYKR